MPDFEKYDLWYTMVKFEEDKSREKERPVMVIALRKDGANGLYVTSQSPRPGYRDYVIKDWEAAGLEKPSTIRLDRVVPLSKDICRRKIGKLSREDQIRIAFWLADESRVYE